MLRILALATPAPSSLSIASSEERPKKKTLSISDPLYLGVQLVAVLDAPGVRVETVVLCHPLAPKDLLAEPLPLALVVHPEEDRLPIPALERPVGGYRRVRSTAPPRLLAPLAGEVRREAHPLVQSLEHRDLQRRPLSRPLAPQERREVAL